MKSVFLTLALLSATPSEAAVLCGKIGTRVVGPQCNPDEACPHWRRLQYDLDLNNGQRMDINAATPQVLQAFGQKTGQNVCVQGQPSRDGSFLVDSVQ